MYNKNKVDATICVRDSLQIGLMSYFRESARASSRLIDLAE